jgi:hypothetical protein
LNLGFTRPEHLVLMVWESLCAFWQTPSGLSHDFYWRVASFWPLNHKSLIGEVLRDGSPISTEELWSSVRVTIGFLVTSLTKALLPRLLSLAGRPAVGRVLVVPNSFHLKMIEATVLFGDLQCCRHFLVPFPRSVPQHNLALELNKQFLRHHGLVFALTGTVKCGTLHRQVCAFPNHVQSIEFTTCGLQSSCRNISRMINWNRMHLSSISRLIAKGLNTYVNKVSVLKMLYIF